MMQKSFIDNNDIQYHLWNIHGMISSYQWINSMQGEQHLQELRKERMAHNGHFRFQSTLINLIIIDILDYYYGVEQHNHN